MDYETKQTYVLKVEGANPHIDPQFIAWGPYKDEATIKVSVHVTHACTPDLRTRVTVLAG